MKYKESEPAQCIETTDWFGIGIILISLFLTILCVTFFLIS